jgi:hypothetical protein
MVSDFRHTHPLRGLRPIFIVAMAGLWILFPAAFDSVAQQTLHHELEVEILHDAKTLRGIDTIRLPRGSSRLRVAFRPGVRILAVEGATYTHRDGVLHLNIETTDPSPNTVVLRYEGVFDDPFEAEPFSMDNPGQGVMGTITQDAAFFLAGSGWYPLILEDTSETFRVSVTAPKGVYAVMEGRLETHADDADRSLSIWSVARPSGPLAMFAGRYVVNERMHDKVRIATYFFPANAGLSTRYLDAVQRHIGRYEALHGPYPFAKFAVVENFFPTGYGFPSFTLLGSRVLRLPFIPDTSLRHEVAHCWWGNGVFVDATGGNWCEGLTTYVADYLSKEEHSFAEARGYRLRTLEKYALLAAGAQDFPLSTFRSRYNPASQAVGYGKAMFVFHMMRLCESATRLSGLRCATFMPSGSTREPTGATLWMLLPSTAACVAMRCVHSTISGSPAQVPCNWPWIAPGLFPRQAVRRWRGTHSEIPPLQRPRAGGGDRCHGQPEGERYPG